MPCTFDLNPNPRQVEGGWSSRDFRLSPNSTHRFVIMTNLAGGACGRCAVGQRGVAWGTDSYLLCNSCGVEHFGAPDLTRIMPQLYRPAPLEDTEYDEDSEDEPPILITKRDKNFRPGNYRAYISTFALGGRDGCSGYKCQTYAAPHRTIPANTQFMLGSGQRGHLCNACFQKLFQQYNSAIAGRTHCQGCERMVLDSQLETTLYDGKMCQTCIRNFFMASPDTDGGWIGRATAQFAIVRQDGHPDIRLYASEQWAREHWFQGTDSRWFLTESERDNELYVADIHYRDSRIAGQGDSAVFQYGTNIIKMHGFPKETRCNELCFGVELEMQPLANTRQTAITSILGGKFAVGRPYILCADSSLGPEGVEMITLPYTLANHKSDKFVQWTKILGDLHKVAKSGQNTTACGMHVHINRRALSNLQMGKMLLVINAPEMQELIVTIAQRSETLYARRFYKKVTEGGKIIGSHGDALNMSNVKGTVELRIFRGNLRYERVMKNLEFAEALCLYSLEQSIQKVVNPADMVAWINDNRSHYPHLVKFLKEEYQPTKAFARVAKRIRAMGDNSDWSETVNYVVCEPTEGDI